MREPTLFYNQAVYATTLLLQQLVTAQSRVTAVCGPRQLFPSPQTLKLFSLYTLANVTMILVELEILI